MTTKVCTKCGLEKDVGEFQKRTQSLDGLRGQCRACRVRSQLAWAKGHNESTRTSLAAWRRSHPEAYRAQRAAYAEKARELKAIWFTLNKERVVSAAKAWKVANPEKCRKWANDTAKRQAATLGNTYIRDKLRIPNPPPELIEAKREQLKMYRAVKQLITTIKDIQNGTE